jgi:hypothetical protein
MTTAGRTLGSGTFQILFKKGFTTLQPDGNHAFSTKKSRSQQRLFEAQSRVRQRSSTVLLQLSYSNCLIASAVFCAFPSASP